MGRGSGAAAIFEAFEEVNARNGDLRGTALGEVLPFELDEQESATLRALLDLSLAEPEAAGFAIEAIGTEPEAADALVEKGLAEKTEKGWKLNEAGYQAAGQFLGMQFLG